MSNMEPSQAPTIRTILEHNCRVSRSRPQLRSARGAGRQSRRLREGGGANEPPGPVAPHTHDGSGRFGGLELDLRYATQSINAVMMHGARCRVMSAMRQIASNCK